ncbi:MAG: transposase [bacterium]
MSSRKTQLSNNEFYHVYNRGVDKREIFLDKKDTNHFFDGLEQFNNEKPIGSLYENSFRKSKGDSLGSKASKLVEIVAYCINPNHFHLILKQNLDKGIEKFMQKLGTSYTKYFNNKNKRVGSLFQDKFKSKHIDNNEYLLYLSAYVNLNDKIHGINNEENIVFSSLKEYTENDTTENICEKSIVLEQYKNKKEYKKFLDDSLSELIRQKQQQKELEE